MRPTSGLVAFAVALALVAALPGSRLPVASADDHEGPLDAIACPAPVPAPGFSDVDPASTHGASIACVAEFGITQGVSSTSYRPVATVQRGQMATFLVRLLRAAGEPITAPGPARFDDVAGTTHAANIEALAAIGIVQGRTATSYAPEAPVRRDQMASFIDRTIRYLQLSLPGDPVGFPDVPPDSSHAASIARLAGADLVLGRTTDTFDPAAEVTRAQMASFLSRTADLLAAADLVHAPYVSRDPVAAPATVVLSDLEATAGVGIDTAGTITFAAVPPGIDAGTVLAAGPTDALPGGLLRQVTAVEGSTVRTAPAALTDAILSGSDRTVSPIRLADVVDEDTLPGVVVTAPTADTIRIDTGDGIQVADGVTASGVLTLDFRTEVSLGLAQRLGRWPYVTQLSALTTGDLDTELALDAVDGASLDAAVTLYRAELAPVTLEVAGVPVSLVPEVEVTLAADGEVSASTSLSGGQSGNGTIGVRYTPASGWVPVARWETDHDDPDQDLDAAADARVSAGAASRLALLGSSTLGAELTPYLRATADPDRVPAWAVHGGVTVDALAEAAPDALPLVDALDRRALSSESRLAEAPPPPEPEPIRIADGWYAAPGTGPVVGGGGTTYRYTVEIADGLGARQDLDAFQRFVDERLGEPTKGWTSRGTLRVQRVDDPDQARIRVVLATPATVDRLCAQAGLDTGGIYSCWNGRFAAINATRWFNGVSHVPDLGLYRSYLINHEVGHGLGFGHRSCPGPGQTAPVMMQLSKSTYGCVPNPHPYP